MTTPWRVNEIGLSTSAGACMVATNHHGSANRPGSEVHRGHGVLAAAQECSTSAARNASNLDIPVPFGGSATIARRSRSPVARTSSRNSRRRRKATSSRPARRQEPISSATAEAVHRHGPIVRHRSAARRRRTSVLTVGSLLPVSISDTEAGGIPARRASSRWETPAECRARLSREEALPSIRSRCLSGRVAVATSSR